ncbi:MFS family permease [Marmoricola sp. OAE513]|uniref:MFS transporter n=1 Tax=Marmoricola sp. OAE513 TaxID=2817894 RepID=UPI001AE0EA53
MSTANRFAGPHALLGLAAVAVAFAAADTYVVVLSLPEMMTAAGLSGEELQRAAPIISGFLLGYVAMLPLIGRIADLRGRLPVLTVSLLVFGLGSLVTAAAYDLPSLVTGRFLQGVGGGGLVPVTLALVADIYPVERRGIPLGVVGAVQELGSVIGPLYGAVVLAFGTWRDIFWINLAVGLVLAAGISALGRRQADADHPRRHVDAIGLALAAAWIAALLLVMLQPDALITSVDWGGPFVPFGDDGIAGSIWASQVGLVAIGLGVLLIGWLTLGRRPFFDVRDWWSTVRQADLLGALLLAVALGGVILAFATANPEVQVFSDQGPFYLAASAAAAAGFAVHQRHAAAPLIPRGAFAALPAIGSLLVSFFIGAALIAALVDIPVFARLTIYGDSQVKAALVLVELLVALPVGALVGGYLTRAFPATLITAGGMVCAAVGFGLMSRWGEDALENHLATGAVLALTGLGFGLALAPVNAALLASTDAAVHGVTSAMLVVSRMVGMLIGISALTTIGLRRYYAVAQSVDEVCGEGRGLCDKYQDQLGDAGIAQLHAIFVGAGISAVVAGLLALVLFRGAQTRNADTPLVGWGA